MASLSRAANATAWEAAAFPPRGRGNRRHSGRPTLFVIVSEPTGEIGKRSDTEQPTAPSGDGLRSEPAAGRKPAS